MNKVKVRYAPSPTGIPHVGNIRTALFNFLFARNKNGEFILRIEDTDRKRLVPQAEEKIEESLKALNLNWDTKIVQSQRLKIYQKYLDELKDKKNVYEDEGAWRFRVEKGKELSWQDGVHGVVSFKSDVLEDFVIVKSDGYPTYHFASVIDDHKTQISHVFRGDEWISSTPRHLLIYQAFGWTPPTFVHLPIILGPNRKKLSKREGAKTVFEYLEEGFLPEALVNFLAFLGWVPSPSEASGEGGKREKELFSLEELVKEFSIERINKNNPIFNLEKLRWFNNQWIKRLDADDLSSRIHDIYPSFDLSKIKELIPITRERMFNLKDFEGLASFFFLAPKLSQVPKVPISLATVSNVTLEFKDSRKWERENIKEMIEKAAEKSKEDRVKTITAVRNIISARTVTPPLYESLEKLGKEETVKRLNEYLKKSTKK